MCDTEFLNVYCFFCSSTSWPQTSDGQFVCLWNSDSSGHNQLVGNLGCLV